MMLIRDMLSGFMSNWVSSYITIVESIHQCVVMLAVAWYPVVVGSVTGGRRPTCGLICVSFQHDCPKYSEPPCQASCEWPVSVANHKPIAMGTGYLCLCVWEVLVHIEPWTSTIFLSSAPAWNTFYFAFDHTHD